MRVLPHLFFALVFIIATIALSGPAVRLSAQTNSPAKGISSEETRQDLSEIRKAGFTYLRSGDWANASDTFAKALGMAPGDYLSLYGSAVALFNLRRPVEARINVDRAIDILNRTKANDALLADSFVLSAVIQAAQKNTEEAIAALLKAIKLMPDHFDANFTLGRAYFGNGDVNKAVKAFRRAVGIMPDNIDARFFLATALERVGDFEAALQEYRAILLINKNSDRGNLGLGVLLIKLEGNTSVEGLAALRKAVSLNGDLYEARITLGKSLLQSNNAEAAVGHLKKAAELAPDNPEPHYQLAMAFRQLGLKAEAAAEFRIVRRIHEERRSVPNN